METGVANVSGNNVIVPSEVDSHELHQFPVSGASNNTVEPLSLVATTTPNISPSDCFKKIISFFSSLNILHIETHKTPFLSTIHLLEEFYKNSESFRICFEKVCQKITHADFKTKKHFAQILHAFNDYQKEFKDNATSVELALFCTMQKIISYGSGSINIEPIKRALGQSDDQAILPVLKDLDSRCLDNFLRVETKDYTPDAYASGICNSPLDLTLLGIQDLIKSYNPENKPVVLIFDFDDTVSISNHRFMGLSNTEWNNRENDSTAYDKEAHIRDVFLSVCAGREYVGFISSRPFIDSALMRLVDFLETKEIAGAIWQDESQREMKINFDGTVKKDVTTFPDGKPRWWCYNDKVYLTFHTPKIEIINDIVNKLAMKHGVKPSDFFVAFCDDDGGNHEVARNAFKQMKSDGVESYELLSVQTCPHEMVEDVYVYREGMENESQA
ncbi:hypothetical protein [Pantoea cypripedii]|uniref:Uncharacterized protein n=1 Tax=Pantoea cypripedii TaxID=55209 RepID=A0A1X1EUG9_PANCY|nr:hypothetical protein [Pantoea cypripedii]MBP2197739.1 hypothetical protein [Pantoea cypripedii]ORM93617.1 hypothetical protein HA50_09765 [Pantoea cypripedii]